LVASSPDVPVQVVLEAVPAAGEEIDQSFDLGDGQRDQTRVGGWNVVGRGGWRCRAGGGRAGIGGGDSTHGQGGHGQHQVPKQRQMIVLLDANVLVTDPFCSGIAWKVLALGSPRWNIKVKIPRVAVLEAVAGYQRAIGYALEGLEKWYTKHRRLRLKELHAAASTGSNRLPKATQLHWTLCWRISISRSWRSLRFR
jgi:hypothetical protein